MEMKSLSGELWREYDFGSRVYRIDNPVGLFVGTATHRVIDGADVVHCVPAPGVCGCVLRWMPKNANSPIQF